MMRRDRLLALCSLVLGVMCSGQAAESTSTDQVQNTPTVGLYQTLELVFQAATAPTNPFDTYLLKLEITDPVGTILTIDGFYDGDGQGGQHGQIWKARMAPYRTGVWSWRTVPGDVPDSALSDLSGQFSVVASSEIGGLVASGEHFKLQSGDWFYPIGHFLDFTVNQRTTHTYMSETVTDAQRDAIMTRQRDFHTANKANVYFANKGDYTDPVTPWVGTAASNDKTNMDLARWKLYDGYIQDFKANHMLVELWFFADDSNFGALTKAERERLLRYGMARMSALGHTAYVIALEWQETFSKSVVTEMGNYLQTHNPWDRMISVHSANRTLWAFTGDSWGTFIASQYYDATPAQANKFAIDQDNANSIPHLQEEVGRLLTDSDTTRRGALWAHFCGGGAGNGTGSDLKAFQRFIVQSTIPFQRMNPSNNLVQGGGSTRFALAEAGHHYLVYSTSGSFTLNVSGSNLRGYWFNPRDPNADLGDSSSVTAGTQSYTPPSTITSDWVLWITDGTNFNTGVTHSTGNAVIVQVLVDTLPTPGVCLGDVTADSQRDLSDAILCIRHLLGLETLSGNALAAADSNQDGTVDLSDVIRLIRDLSGLEPLPACQ